MCPLIPRTSDHIRHQASASYCLVAFVFKYSVVLKVQNKAEQFTAENILLTLASHDLMINLGGRMGGVGARYNPLFSGFKTKIGSIVDIK